MNDDSAVLLTIGQLSRLTGLPVRTIRFWSDIGAVPPAGRTDGGYRLYRAESVARLELVATLRELGLGLDEVRRVLAKETTVADVAATHVEALDAQIRTLRLRRAVLSTVANRRSDTEEMTLMNRLAKLSAQERRQIIEDFVDEVFGDLDADPQLKARMRDTTPELPEDPTAEQVDAWVEMAELVQDRAFRQHMRHVMELHARGRAGQEQTPGAYLWFAKKLTWLSDEARERGVAPESPEAGEILDRLLGDTDRAEVLGRLTAGMDVRAERYRQLMGIINGRPSPVPQASAYTWVIDALRAHRTRG
ncbi:MerR family transcriptional regulator [Streptosporangium sp. NPDC087985]|uniref:helix-turn-helix domain-containing protein n=1 Tax=Streptosporangium sp. NPDC087985 TaxID=3366196 RepID=UPI00382C0A0E